MPFPSYTDLDATVRLLEARCKQFEFQRDVLLDAIIWATRGDGAGAELRAKLLERLEAQSHE